MSDHLRDAAVRGVSDVYVPTIAELHEAFFLRSTVRILVVVDSEISLTEGPSAFGVGRVVRLLRESTVGCTSFRVDLARRNNAAFAVNASPAPNQPRYEGFRFNSQDGGVAEVVGHGWASPGSMWSPGRASRRASGESATGPD